MNSSILEQRNRFALIGVLMTIVSLIFMKISTKGRYALRMLIDLAEHQNNGFIALKDIAARQGISKKYLEQIRMIEITCVDE